MMGISTKTIRLIVTALLLVCPAALAASILPDADLADANPKANVDDGWRGQALLDDMTPGQYGEFRWNGGTPKRGLITDKR